MAQGRVENEDLFGKDLFKKQAEDAKSLLVVLEEIEKSLKEIAKTQINAINNSTNNSTGVKKKEEAIKKINEAERISLKIAKQKASVEEKLKIANSDRVQKIITTNEQLKVQNRINRNLVKEENKVFGAYANTNAKLNRLIATYKDLAVRKQLGEKLSKKEISQHDQLQKEILQTDSALKKVDNSMGRNQRSVGKYGLALNGLKSAFGALGITFALTEIIGFSKELVARANEIKGVEFAFQRLGVRGSLALENVRKSTRGLLNDLDIKSSLVDFDNFNISLEESDTLFEFLAVRAAQTGKSIDSLKDSLVEGLSKESKLRIDNLGISAKQLNDELAVTPNFVQAVANIAKKEIAEAGNILDEAASSQQKFNAEIVNTKNSLATGLNPVFDRFFQITTFLLRNLKTIGGTLATITVAITAYVAITRGAAIATNLYRKATILATKSTKAFSVAVKANPLGIFISLLTIAAGLFVTYKDNAEEATKAQEELNEAQRESNRIQQSLTGIEGRVESIDKLNKEQLKNLLNTIDLELAANEEKQAKLLGNEKSILAESEKIKSESLKRIKELEEEILTETDPLRVNELRGKLRLFKGNIEIAKSIAQNYSDIEEGTTRKIIEENIKKLEAERKLVVDRLKIQGVDKRQKKLNKLEDERISKLKELKNELSEIESARERLVTKGDLQSKAAFAQLTIQAEELERIIQVYERILKGEDVELPTQKPKGKDGKSLLDKARAERDKRGEEDKQAVLEYQKFVEGVLSEIGNIAEDVFSERIRLITEELEKASKRADELTEKAKRTRLENSESIAFEQKKQAELEQQREKERKKQERAKALFAVLESYQVNAANDTETALPNTIRDVGILKVLSKSLGSFFDGTDNVADSLGKPQQKGRDGYHIRVDGSEQIWSNKDQAETGYKTRDEIKAIVNSKEHSLMDSISLNNLDKLSSNNIVLDNRGLSSEIKRLSNSIDKISANQSSIDYDSVKNLLIMSKKQGNKKTTTRSKLF